MMIISKCSEKYAGGPEEKTDCSADALPASGARRAGERSHSHAPGLVALDNP